MKDQKICTNRLAGVIEDKLLSAYGNIQHDGEAPEADEKLSTSLENMVVLTWLRLIHRELPNLVKQWNGTELRSQTLASLRPEISQVLDSLLNEIHSAADVKVLRASLKDKPFDRSKKYTGSGSKQTLHLVHTSRSPVPTFLEYM